MSRTKTLLLSAALVAGTAGAALARENYALLVGVSEYPALSQQYWLKGPANDVTLVRDYLVTAAPVPFAAGNVTVLADGVAGAGDPTLAGIRSAFADLTTRVAPGDFVYLHFSGHGTQAPAADPESEPDGLDEMFLPRDIGPWSDDVGAVENGLVDDEIASLIGALRKKGADVWVVFDSCHSGTVTRAIPTGEDDVRTRQLPPQALGIDPDAAPATRALPDPRAPDAPPVDLAGGEGGSLVAFFAAQSNEVTPEKNLPKGKKDRKPQGVFTYTLMEVLAENPGASYGQIAQEVTRRYATKGLARSTPLVEGDLDRTAFSGEAQPRIQQWPAKPAEDGSLSLAAGSLHGLTTGETLLILAKATDPAEAALGRALVQGVETLSAKAQAEGPLPADAPKTLYLRRTETALDFSLTIALPEEGSAPAAALQAARDSLAKLLGPRITLAPPGAEADLRLAVLPGSPRPDALWILPATGLAEDLATTPSVATEGKPPETLAEDLGSMLSHMARAMNLMKMAGAVGTEGLDVGVTVLSGPSKNELAALPGTGVPKLIPGDQVHVIAENRSDTPVDVNVLYIGADWSVTHWAAERLQPGDTLKKGLFKISDSFLGRERMVVVMTPAKPQSPVEDLSFLAQDAMPLTREVGGGSGFDALLTEAGFGSTTRAVTALDEDEADAGPRPVMMQIELMTVPAP